MTFKKIETSSEPQNRKKRELNKTARILLVVAGTILVLLSILGIFLPILPTTPLLILAATLYARSSKRFYGWLTNNRFLGKYIKDYQEGKGIPLKAKITAIILIWDNYRMLSIFCYRDTLGEDTTCNYCDRNNYLYCIKKAKSEK